jgi:hypothetical protein
MIVSPGPEACWTLARVLNGAEAVPIPTAAAVALTYQLWPCALLSYAFTEFVAAMLTAAVIAMISGVESAIRIRRVRQARSVFRFIMAILSPTFLLVCCQFSNRIWPPLHLSARAG